MNTKDKIRGQALVEFALAIPLVILIFTVLMDLGRVVFYYSSLTNGVREGTRYAIVHPTDTLADLTAIRNVVISTSSLNPANLVVTAAVTGTDNDHITVNGTFTFRPVTPGLSLLLQPTGQITLRAQSTMEISPASQ